MRVASTKRWFRVIGICAIISIAAIGCGKKDNEPADAAAATPAPKFALAWSEYPSWSAFYAAEKAGLINGKAGVMGSVEKKWNVDIELIEADYDTCIQLYGSKKADAACLTNMDTLGPSASVKSVAILPTSTGNGGDACLVVDTIADVKGLKGKKVYGLASSVSEYCFVRCLQTLGENPADYTFADMGPGEAATAMIQKQPDIEAIMVWNPFVLQTLDKRKDVKTLFDSSKIPGEIIDMVIMSQDSLSKPGGEAFACAVIDAYYQLNARLADPATRDQSLLAISEKFAKFDVKTMEKVVTQTQFYATPDAGIKVLTSDVTKKNMEGIVAFFLGKKVIETATEIGYGDKASAPNAAFRFDPSYIKKVSEKK